MDKKLFACIFLLCISGCCSLHAKDDVTKKLDDAIRVCGDIRDLQLKNVTILEKINAVVVDQKYQKTIEYGDLSSELRLSAIRSQNLCIQLQTNKITGEQFDSLMAAELALSGVAEKSLTSEQLKSSLDQGYKTISELVVLAKMSDSGAKKLKNEIENTSVNDMINYNHTSETAMFFYASNDNKSELQILSTRLSNIEVKMAETNSQLNALPLKIYSKVIGSEASDSITVTVYFTSGQYQLSNEAKNKLAVALKSKATPESRVSIIASADSTGTYKQNSELSYQRAQAVANWIIAELVVQPHLIHISAIGESARLSPSELNRSVTIKLY